MHDPTLPPAAACRANDAWPHNVSPAARTARPCLACQSRAPRNARAFEAGADDYVVKPFALGDLAIRYDTRAVTVAGRTVDLTTTEYVLLRVLSQNAGRVVPFDTTPTVRLWPPRGTGATRTACGSSSSSCATSSATAPTLRPESSTCATSATACPDPATHEARPRHRGAGRRVRLQRGDRRVRQAPGREPGRTMNSGNGCRMPAPAPPALSASQLRSSAGCAAIVRLPQHALSSTAREPAPDFSRTSGFPVYRHGSRQCRLTAAPTWPRGCHRHAGTIARCARRSGSPTPSPHEDSRFGARPGVDPPRIERNGVLVLDNADQMPEEATLGTATST